MQVHLPRNQLYVSRVSPKMNLGEILDEVCREKNLDRNKYELRHPGEHSLHETAFYLARLGINFKKLWRAKDV